MNRIEKLKDKVKELYERREPNRAEWADWLYENHIFLVEKYGEELSKRYGANQDLVVAASMLHDIADAVMARENPDHEEKSNEIARDLLEQAGFSEAEIQIIVEDAMRFHGCRNGKVPQTLEGKVMASADALVHLKSNFYDFALETLRSTDTRKDIQEWALPKIERDYRMKIAFDDLRNETSADYERVKKLFE